MSLKRTDIENIAWLARLSLKQDEISVYEDELGKIFELVEQMKTVNTDSITAIAHPLDIGARLREDNVTETDNREENQDCAPETEAGFYLVPKVID